MSLKTEKGRATITLILAAVCCVGLYVFAAQRKVSILADANKITLTNGSSSSVTYNLTCFDSTGAQNLSETGKTLAGKATRKLGLSNCSNGTAPVAATSDQSIYSCYATNRGLDISGICPQGATVCTYNELQAKAGVMNAPSSAFYARDLTFNPTYYSTNSGTSFYSSSGYPSWYNSASYFCNGSPTISGAKQYCRWGSLYGNVACCRTSAFVNSLSSCEVTITGGSGHLQSPMFKGGAPF